MLEQLESYDGSAKARRLLVADLHAGLQAALASAGGGDLKQVARLEAMVAADPAARIRLNDTGAATLYAVGRRYQAGCFETPRICELSARALRARTRTRSPARLRLWIFTGASPATDIGTLQATAPPGSLFQVASQFNCLEAPGAMVIPVAEYVHDPTQGPRAAISAFPGALVRHYAAPDLAGQRFVQTHDGCQINLLADVCEPGVATVRNGYLRASEIANPRLFARLLEDRFESIRVGVHDGIEVVLGYDWAGSVDCAPHRTIAQVLCSTVAGGMYGQLEEEDSSLMAICRQLQRAAYLGTLLAAAALGKDRVVLTLIGGGAFANPIRIIWEGLLWALEQAEQALHRDLLVIVNGRNLGDQIPAAELQTAARVRGGEVVQMSRGGAVIEGA